MVSARCKFERIFSNVQTLYFTLAWFLSTMSLECLFRLSSCLNYMLLLLLLLFRHPGALAHMDLPRARERNKTLVARFWTPGVGNCLILPPQKSNAMISKTFPDKKWVKTPPKNEKTTITAKQPCIYQGDTYIRSAHLTLILPNMTVKFTELKLHCHARAKCRKINLIN